MNDGLFMLDTNVLVYTFDRRDARKRVRADELVTRALQGEGIISYQVAQELLNVAVRKFKPAFTHEQCLRYTSQVLEPLCGVFASIDLLRLTLETRANTGYGFYDSLIVASAAVGGCKTLYSEDLQHGRVVRGVRIVNPFVE